MTSTGCGGGSVVLVDVLAGSVLEEVDVVPASTVVRVVGGAVGDGVVGGGRLVAGASAASSWLGPAEATTSTAADATAPMRTHQPAATRRAPSPMGKG